MKIDLAQLSPIWYLMLTTILLRNVAGAPEIAHSTECKVANDACEQDTDCVHRLAVLQATCVTNTCQPQCRNAVLNLFQNRIGRALLRTDLSCIPGRHELQLCNLMPNRTPLYCNLARLTCEADLMCSARWEVYVSECESEAVHRDCSARCRHLLSETLASAQGTSFAGCTCASSEDKLCEHLRDVVLGSCIQPIITATTATTMQTSANDSMNDRQSILTVQNNGLGGGGDGSSSLITKNPIPLVQLCSLLTFAWLLL